jgi:SAM-dependent methyltransferase
MAKYQHGFDADTSYGRAVGLLERADLAPGLVLDVGCGFGAVAEVLTSQGFTYVGVDIDRAALDDLTARGFEAHQVGLLVPEAELVTALSGVVGGRPLVAVLALDVLEHLLDVPATLRALATLTAPSDATLVVSYPNVTHFDVGAKLLMGRWDTTEEGLLDRTHTQFLSGGRLPQVFAEAGWHQVDAQDVIREVSDQCFPSYTPVLRPGTPANELLRRWRSDADPFGHTFQFVRRFALGEPLSPVAEDFDETRPFASVIVAIGPEDGDRTALDALLADLDAQHEPAAEVAVLDGDGDDLRALNHALVAARSRYVFVVRPGVRLAPDWLAAFEAVEHQRPGQVLRCEVAGIEPNVFAEASGSAAPDLLATGHALGGAVLDPLHAGYTIAPIAGTFAVPAEVAQTAGLLPHPDDGTWAVDAWLARSALLCGVQPVDQVLVGVAIDAAGTLRRLDPRIDAALDVEPMVLPAGSASRLADLRNRVLELEEQLAFSNDERQATGSELETLIQHLHELGGRIGLLESERDHWRAVAERKPTVQARALLSRLATKLEG